MIRELEIIGEAAGNVSDACRDDHPTIPFKDMVSMRNRLIHRYFGVDAAIVWKTCTEDLATLRTNIRRSVGKNAA